MPFPGFPLPKGEPEPPENPRVAGSIPALSTSGGTPTEKRLGPRQDAAPTVGANQAGVAVAGVGQRAVL